MALTDDAETLPNSDRAPVPRRLKCKREHHVFVPGCPACSDVARYFMRQRRERDRAPDAAGCTCSDVGSCVWCKTHCGGCKAPIEPHQRWCDHCKRKLPERHRRALVAAEVKRLARGIELRDG